MKIPWRTNSITKIVLASKKLAFHTAFAVAFLSTFLFTAIAHSGSRQEQPAERKEVPVVTFQNLFPPYINHDYFKGHEAHAFQFNATSFSLTNAWWLAEAATLVYANENFVRTRFAGAGLSKLVFFDEKSTQCFVASNDRFAIVAFRGSEIVPKEGNLSPDKFGADVIADLDIRLVDWRRGGKVHRGFKDALEEVWPDLELYLKRLEQNGCRIWITGHSLGGALATLAGSRYGKAQGVYAFGSPRVGDHGFRENFKIDMYRIVYKNDIVARIPPSGSFYHVGTLKYIDGNGTIRNQVVEKQGDENAAMGIIPSMIGDHVPLLYTIHLWNNLTDEKKGKQ